MSNNDVVDIGAVVCRVVAAAATASTGVGVVEELLAACDLRAFRVLVIGPCVEQIKPAGDFRHRRQRLGTATRAIGVETPDARHNELRCKKRFFESDDVGDDLRGAGGPC